MAGDNRATTNHDEIRRWAEQRGGHPAAVKATAGEGDPGVIRIDFPGHSGEESLREISWDEFFDKFEEKHLSFIYQETAEGGGVSRFFKLVDRDAES